jgi:aminopeptidase N
VSIYSEIEGHTVLSNTPCTKVQENWWDFEETPLMSTYLLAFVIGKFDFIELPSIDGLKVRSYTKKGRSHDALEHTKIAAEAIKIYEDYF